MNADFERAGLRVFERGWLSSNNIFFPDMGSGESVLVDTGYCAHADQTLALVRAGLPPGGRLNRIVNTHLHSDHCGGNAVLQMAFDCRIDVPAAEALKVDAWDTEALTFAATGQSCPRFTRHGELVAGSDIRLGGRPWQVYGAPGHDPHSVVLHQSELGLLISADALWEDGFGVVFPEIEGKQAFDDVRETLDQLAALHVRWVIPGHGQPFSGVRAAVDRAHRRLDAFMNDPTRHARYAAKVLVKFHMLEWRSISLSELLAWMAETPYVRVVHRLYFEQRDFAEWTSSIVADLVDTGALRMDAGTVRDGSS